MTSDRSRSARASGVLRRHVMPTVRDGCGSGKHPTATGAERASTATAISGISVTPSPAPTICTSVESDEPSKPWRPRTVGMSQNDRA